MGGFGRLALLVDGWPPSRFPQIFFFFFFPCPRTRGSLATWPDRRPWSGENFLGGGAASRTLDNQGNAAIVRIYKQYCQPESE